MEKCEIVFCENESLLSDARCQSCFDVTEEIRDSQGIDAMLKWEVTEAAKHGITVSVEQLREQL